MCQGSLQYAEEAPDDTVVIAVTCRFRGQKFFGPTVPLDPVAPGELEIGHGLVQRTLVRVEIRKNNRKPAFLKKMDGSRFTSGAVRNSNLKLNL